MSKEQYHLAVIGGGAAGLTAARAAIRMGVRVAIIEKNKLGGDCTWVGCVPSKALIAAARLAQHAREGAHMGIHIADIRVDFAQVMAHVHDSIREIYAEESPEVLRGEGIDVYETTAKFVDPYTLELGDGQRITAKKFVIATGSGPLVPKVFADVPHLTNKTLFNLTALPEHLIVLGGGPIGTEMAQAFNRLGSKVTVIDMETRLLPRDDAEASQIVMDTLRAEGVNLKLGIAAESATGSEGTITVTLKDGSTITGTHLLLALGRRPTIEGLDPQAAGIALDERGQLILNDKLQTSQVHIYAAGDVTGGPQFTHVAGSQGWVAARNLLLPLSSKGLYPHPPWATYTEPEVAQAGLTEAEARKQHGNVEITRLPMTRSDRAVVEGKPQGFLKAVHLPSGKLLGVTIVGYNASELVNEWLGVINSGGSVRAASGKMRVYPSISIVNSVLSTAFFKKWLGRSLGGRIVRTLVPLLNR